MATEYTTGRVWVTRTILVLGFGACLVYLGWRVAGLSDGSPRWMSVPSLTLEVLGVVCSAVLARALWPTTTARSPVGRSAVGDVDVVVVHRHEAIDDLRTTLVALRSVRSVGSVTVVDRTGRLAAATVAVEFGVGYVVPDGGVAVAVRAVARRAFALVLAAGDVPVPDIVERLETAIDGDDVAVVQGLGVSLVSDAPERGIDQRHDLLFERAGLNPRLGARGCAAWLGSGSLVRVAALDMVGGIHHTDVDDLVDAGFDLVAAGERIVCAGGTPVVALHVATDVAVARVESVERDRTLLRRWWSPRAAGDRRARGAVRVAASAWSVRAASPYGVVAVVALVATVLLSGRLPFDVASPVALLVGVPGAAAVSMGLGLASGWTLRPGDRTRRALAAGSRVWSGPVLTVAVLGLVLVVRMVSDRALHVAPEIDRSRLSVVVLVAVWLLAMALDVLRDDARRGRVRRAARATSSISAVLADRFVSVVDLTAHGAGLRSTVPMHVGDRATFEVALPTRSGITSVVVDSTVRNVRSSGSDWRIGVEFAHVEPAVANALAEYCVIETSRRHLGVPLYPDDAAAPGAGALHWVVDATVAVRGRAGAGPIAQPSKP